MSMKASFREILYIAATIYGEARGEYHPGKVGVGWVIRNRAQNPAWWGKSIVGVCTKPYQFSCWNNNDPNSGMVKKIARNAAGVLDDPVVQQCMRAALEVLQGKRDPVGGADHYHTLSISPAWRDDSKCIGAVGHHQFYKLGSS